MGWFGLASYFAQAIGAAQPSGKILGNSGRTFRFECTFPHYCHFPTLFQKRSNISPVAHCIRGELSLPELRSGCRNGCKPAAFMPMPEAPVDKNYRPISWKDDVGSTGEVARMKSVPQPDCMQRTPQLNFRFGVLSPDARHHP